MPNLTRWVVLGFGLLASPAAARPAAQPTLVVEQRGEVHGARMFASVATDPYRKRTLLFGGYTTGGIRNDTLEWDGIGWSKRSPSVLPSPRYAASMVFEPKRRRILLFGGIEASGPSTGFALADNRTWEWTGGDWRVLSTQDAPPSRGTAAMTADPRTGDVYLFGGGLEASALDDFWRFDGQRWIAIPKPPGAAWPSARAGASLAFDPISQKLVLFGGVTFYGINPSGMPTSGSPFVDTWLWDGSSWSEAPTATRPAAREPVVISGQSVPLTGRSIVVWDQRRSALILMQEALEGIQTWRWDPSAPSWIQESTPTAGSSPNLRFFSTSFWDAARSEVHVFGGLATTIPVGSTLESLLANIDTLAEPVDGTLAHEEWAWNGAVWRRWNAAGEPGARRDSAIAFHLGLGVGVLFGGRFGSETVLGDNYLWDGGRWYEAVKIDGTVTDRPPARSAHALVYDPDRSAHGGAGAIVLFGGYALDGAPLDDTWVWRDGWSKLATSVAPSARARHVMAQVPGGVVLYGGLDTDGARKLETWFLPSAGAAWQNLDLALQEGASMAATSLGRHAYLYGGSLRAGGLRENVFLRFEADRSWTVLDNPADGPERRSDCALVADPTHGSLILSGGQGPGEAKPNWFRYDVTANTWASFEPRPYDPLGGAPGRLLGAASFYDPIDRTVTLFGGERRDLEIVVGGTWRLRQLGDDCEAGQACADGLTCVDGACCEATACGPCESCAMPSRRGICAARGVVAPAPGCDGAEGLACNAEGRCRVGPGAACTEDAQCASGACAAGACCPAEGCAETCLDQSTRKNKDGTTTACGAYLCTGTACLTACNSVEDCAVGHVCSTEKQCVPELVASNEEDGCSCDVPRASRTASGFMVGLAACAATWLRRRRRQLP